MICVTIGCGSHKRMIEEHQKLAADGVRFVELRLDYLRKKPELHRLLPERPTAVLATARRKEDGGQWRESEEARLGLLRELIVSGVDYIDLEVDVAPKIPRFGKTKRVVSYHNMEETPEDLDGLRQKMLDECDPDIIKIAVTPKCIGDVFRLVDFLRRANAPERIQAGEPKTLGISMTEYGWFTRVLGKRFGCPYTYAGFSEKRILAPGLLPYKTLRDLYRYDDINSETKIFGVIADPVQHSMSPAIHNRSFVEMGLNCAYVPFRVAPEDLDEFIDRAPEIGVCGLSVTIPHKVEIMKRLDGYVDPAVRAIGACNTVVWGPDGRLNGYNTDYLAALLSIETAMGGKAGAPSPLQGASAMVLGAGGAAQAVVRGLIDRGARVIIAARSDEKGREAAKRLGCEFCSWRDRGAYIVQVLANCTSVGMFPNVDESPMEQQMLRAGTVVFDAVYNPETTYLLRMARQRGCKTVSGVEMFVGQACLQYKLFTGQKASGSFMRSVVRGALSAVRTTAEETN